MNKKILTALTAEIDHLEDRAQKLGNLLEHISTWLSYVESCAKSSESRHPASTSGTPRTEKEKAKVRESLLLNEWLEKHSSLHCCEALTFIKCCLANGLITKEEVLESCE